MKRTIRLLIGVAVATLVLAGLNPTPATAQDKAKQAAQKVVLDNEKVRVIEIRWKPGDENRAVPRDARVIRALTSGTLQRIYADGKTETVKYKTGDVVFNPAVVGDAPQYTNRNIGKSELALYIVVLK